MGNSSLLKEGLQIVDDLNTADLERLTKIVEWGIWSRGGLPTGVPGSGVTAAISDDEALQVDRQVAKLRTTFYRGFMVINELYVRGKGVNELARILGISNRRVMNSRDQGLSIIYGGLK